MGFFTILTEMIVLFILMSVGFICNRKGIIKEAENKMLANLLMTIGIPSMILASVANGSPFENQSDLIYVVLIVSVVNLASPLFGIVAVKLLNIKKDRDLYKFMFIFPNAGMIGFPVIQAILGNEALIYAAIFQLPHCILTFSYGVYLMSGKQGNIQIHDLINPCIIASILACIICLLDWKEPYILEKSFSYLGSMTSPLGMIVIGSSLSNVDFTHIFDSLKKWIFIFLKLIVLPVIIYLLLKIFVSNPVLIQVIAYTYAMPVATNAVILSNLYDGNVNEASKIVFITTVLSIFTIPVISLMF